jgi:short-subunit dehydrogenase
MIARRRGRIAIVSSVAGYRGLPTSAYYGATKAALINLAEALKFDLDRHGVTMQLIDPGFVRTPLTDKNEFAMPFRITPEEAAARIAKGLQSTRFEITFPRRFTYILKLARCLPYRLYFPLVAWATRQ